MSNRDPQVAIAHRLMESGFATEPMLVESRALERLERKGAEISAELLRLNAALRGGTAHTLAEAARAEGDLPVGWEDELIEDEDSQRRLRKRAEVVADAVAELKQGEVAVAQSEVEAVIVQILRPRLAKVIETITATRDVASLSDAQALTSPESQRTQYLAYKEACDEYALLREAQAWCFGLSGGRNEASDRYGEVRQGLPAFWPAAAMMGRGVPQPPWAGMTTGERLTWLLDHGADIWMPTSSEVEAEWHKAVEARGHKARVAEFGVYGGS